MYTLIGALFPDIDTKSKIQRVIYIIFLVLLLLLAVHQADMPQQLQQVFLPAYRLWCITGHFSFDIIFNISGCSARLRAHKFYYPAYTPTMVYNVIFFLAGVFSHLFADKKLS